MSEFSGRPIVMGRFAVGDKMGSGMQATVFRGKDSHDGKEVALRIISRRHLTPSKLSKLEREINMMKIVNHPNVVALKYVEMDMEWQRLNGTTKRVAMMVLDLAENGELFDYLLYSGHFSDAVTRAYMKQLTSALSACHSNFIYHRDIKPENILLDGNFQLKLADFGLSTIQENEDALLQTDCGTKSYMSPEVFSSQPYRGDDADIWSSAVVMFIMMCGNPPFQQANGKDWWFNAISLNRHDRFWAAHLRNAAHMAQLPNAQNFLNNVFRKNPSDRYNLEQMMSDVWMTEGEQLSPEQLKHEMMQKKHAVTQGKEREARESANRARRGGSDVDPFSASTAYRSVTVTTSDNSVRTTEIPRGDIEKMPQSSFFTSIPVQRLITELHTAARTLDPTAEISGLKEGCGVRVVLKVGGQQFEFEGETVELPALPVELYARVCLVSSTSSNNAMVYGVELIRISGDVFPFQQSFRQLKAFINKVEDSLSDGRRGDADDAEPALIDNIGMI